MNTKNNDGGMMAGEAMTEAGAEVMARDARLKVADGLAERYGFQRYDDPDRGYPCMPDYGYMRHTLVGMYSVQWNHSEVQEALRKIVDVDRGKEIPEDVFDGIVKLYGVPGDGAHWEVVGPTGDVLEEIDVIEMRDGGLAFNLTIEDALRVAYEHYCDLMVCAIREIPMHSRWRVVKDALIDTASQ